MTKRARHTKRRKTKATTPAPSEVRRLRYGAAAAVVVVLFVLTLMMPFWRHAKSGWPKELTRGSARRFNVLVITLDTTRADHLGCYGYETAETPVLDTLAGQAIRFDDAVAVVPITLPSHATIFTGLDPPNHGVRHNGEFRLDDEHETLAEVLRDAGYETAAFISAFVLDARFGLSQGFDLYDDNVGVATADSATAFVKPIYERPAGAVTDAATQWLGQRDRDRPFFAWVHYFDPHDPYDPPPPFAARFRGRSYDGEIAYMDAEIGRLLEAVKTHGKWDDTLIVVVGDHGEGLGEHNETTHAKLIYDATMRVPLLIACPSLFRRPHVVVDRVVSVADVFPTVLDLIGVESNKPCDGRSLVDGQPDPDRMIYLETLAPYLDHGWSPLYGIRRHRDKYILAPRPEYYDLQADPDELNDLYRVASGSTMTARDTLAADLSARLAESPSIDGVVATAQPLDPESIRKLESLGYVGTISPAGAGDTPPDPKDMMPVMRALDRADALAAAGRLEQALALTRQAAALSPNDSRVLLKLGKLYLHRGLIEEAETVLRDANAIRPTAQLCILIAQIMIADGRLGQARDLLDRAETLDPVHGGIYLAKGDLYARLGRPEEAIEAYERARQVDPYRATTEAEARIARIRELMEIIPKP